MTQEVWPAPGGMLDGAMKGGDACPPYALRLEGPGDQPFLRALFLSWKGAELLGGGMAPWMAEPMLEMQWRAHGLGISNQFPDAERWIICMDGVAAGRLLLGCEPGCLHIADISLLPEWRGRGVGGHLLHDLQERARLAGCALTLSVARHNIRALALYLRLGFRPQDDGGVQIAMLWRAVM